MDCRSRSLNPLADPNRASSGLPDRSDYLLHFFAPGLPLQLLDLHWQSEVQAAPPARKLIMCWHDPLPLHTSLVQALLSVVHSVPLGS